MAYEVADPTRVLARLDAYQAVAADPLRDGMQKLRWSEHDPVVALIAAHVNGRRFTVVAEIPGTGPVRHLADTTSGSASSAPV